MARISRAVIRQTKANLQLPAYPTPASTLTFTSTSSALSTLLSGQLHPLVSIACDPRLSNCDRDHCGTAPVRNSTCKTRTKREQTKTSINPRHLNKRSSRARAHLLNPQLELNYPRNAYPQSWAGSTDLLPPNPHQEATTCAAAALQPAATKATPLATKATQPTMHDTRRPPSSVSAEPPPAVPPARPSSQHSPPRRAALVRARASSSA